MAHTFGVIDTDIYNRIYDTLESADLTIDEANRQIKSHILSSYTDPIRAISKARDLVTDRIRYALADVNNHLAVTPIGFIHSKEDKYKSNDYWNKFITGRLPLPSTEDPPGDTVAGELAKLGTAGTDSSSSPSPSARSQPGCKCITLVNATKDGVTFYNAPDTTFKSPPKPCPGCFEAKEAQLNPDGSAQYLKGYRAWTDSAGIWGTKGKTWQVPDNWDKQYYQWYPQGKCAPPICPKTTPTPPGGPGGGSPGGPGGGSPGGPGGGSPGGPGGGSPGGPGGGTPGGPSPGKPPGPSPGPGKPPGPVGPPTGPSPGGPGGPTMGPPGSPTPILLPGPIKILPEPPPTPTPTPPLKPIPPGPPSPEPIGGNPPSPGLPITPTPTPNPKGPYPPPPTPTPPYKPSPPSPGEPIPEPPPTPTPPIYPAPPGKHCTGDNRYDPCWREIGGKQGSDREIYVSPGWVGRVDDNKGSAPLWSAPDPSGMSSQISINGTSTLPGVCDYDYQYSLVGNDGFFQAVSDDMDTLVKQVWDQIQHTDDAGTASKSVFLAPLMMLIGYTYQIGAYVSKMGLAALKSGNSCIDLCVQSEFIINVLNTVTFGAARKVVDIVQTRNDFECPTRSPSPGEAASAWLNGTIDECTLQAYVQAGNLKYDQYKDVVVGGRFKFSALELQALKMRQGIVRGDFRGRLRELGALDDDIVKELETLSNQIPGPADIVRFMVRDADDENGVVKEFNLDADFDQKYQKQLREWGANQGLSEKVAKYHWRSHWSIPSPTQLYQILHRFRNKKGVNAQQLDKNIRDALKQQDILPFWIDYLLGISYNPLTRTDAKRAYNEGTIDDATLRDVFIQNGYSDDDADLLVQFANVERKQHVNTLEPVKLYSEGLIGQTAMVDYAKSLGYQGDAIQALIDQADVKKSMDRQARISNRLISGFRSFKLSYKEAMSAAQKQGLDTQAFQGRLDEERITRDNWNKHVAIGQLCNMLDEEIISGSDYVKEARDAGWSAEDAGRYLNLCENKIEAKKAKKELADQAAQEKKAKAALKAQEQSDRQAQRQLQQIQNQLDRVGRLKDQINGVLEHAASTYAAKAGIDTAEAAGTVSGTFKSLIAGNALTPLAAAKLVDDIATNWGKFTETDFATIAGNLAAVDQALGDITPKPVSPAEKP